MKAMMMDSKKLHDLHRKFLFDNSPIDRIIEDRGISAYNNEIYSEFVTSAGGDVSVYQVSGATPTNYKLSIK